MLNVEIEKKGFLSPHRREPILVRYIERTLRGQHGLEQNFVFGGDIFRRVLSMESNIYCQYHSAILDSLLFAQKIAFFYEIVICVAK